MKLTWKQRALRPIINFFVERYFPKGAFYGNDYLNVFNDKGMVDKWGSSSIVSAMYLVGYLRDNKADSGTFKFTGMTNNGNHVGDWELTLERMDIDE